MNDTRGMPGDKLPTKPKNGLEYLAGPYSDSNDAIQKERCEQLTAVAGQLMAQGRFIFSPITHTRPIAESAKLPGDAAFWIGYDESVLAGCSRLLVLMLPEWRQSKGVKLELAIAERLGIPIQYLDPDDFGITVKFGGRYRHFERPGDYRVIGTARDATTGRGYRRVVLYSPVDNPTSWYVRDEKEFLGPAPVDRAPAGTKRFQLLPTAETKQERPTISLVPDPLYIKEP